MFNKSFCIYSWIENDAAWVLLFNYSNFAVVAMSSAIEFSPRFMKGIPMSMHPAFSQHVQNEASSETLDRAVPLRGHPFSA